MQKQRKEFISHPRLLPPRRHNMEDKKLDTAEEVVLTSSAVVSPPSPSGTLKIKKKLISQESFDKWKAWIYLLPALILLAVFTVYPIVNTVRIAFLEGYTSAAVEGKESFAFGFGNFIKAVEAPPPVKNLVTGKMEYQPAEFVQCLKNTFILCFITVPLSTILALVIAVCLNSIKFLRKFFQTIFFIPYVTNSIAIGMVFKAMFDIIDFKSVDGDITQSGSLGIINNILGVFNIAPVNWMSPGSGYWNNMAVLIIYIVWNALPFKILILLGGLQSVNKQYYEAAKIDSTPRLRVFTRITVPLLSPMIAYVVITGFIGGFKEYSSVIGIFGDPPKAAGGENMNTIVGYVYNCLGRDTPKYGEASAAALILFGIIFVVTMINLYVSNKKTHY